VRNRNGYEIEEIEHLILLLEHLEAVKKRQEIMYFSWLDKHGLTEEDIAWLAEYCPIIDICKSLNEPPGMVVGIMAIQHQRELDARNPFPDRFSFWDQVDPETPIPTYNLSTLPRTGTVSVAKFAEW